MKEILFIAEWFSTLSFRALTIILSPKDGLSTQYIGIHTNSFDLSLPLYTAFFVGLTPYFLILAVLFVLAKTKK